MTAALMLESLQVEQSQAEVGGGGKSVLCSGGGGGRGGAWGLGEV